MNRSRSDGGVLAVETSRLTKHFGERKALGGVDLACPVGSPSVFLGVNGAGKTTSMRLLLFDKRLTNRPGYGSSKRNSS
jgi:ABC-2 type transport system ATP-binding protein